MPDRGERWARRSLLLGFAVLLLCVLTLSGAADAHSGLVGSNPADGARLSGLSVVELQFDGPVQGQPVILVDDPAGHDHRAGSPTVNGAHVQQPVRVDGPGTYRIAYRVVARDGHPTTGVLRVTVDPRPASAAGGGEVDPRPPSSSLPAPTAHASFPAAWWPAGAALLLVLGSVGLRMRHRVGSG